MASVAVSVVSGFPDSSVFAAIGSSKGISVDSSSSSFAALVAELPDSSKSTGSLATTFNSLVYLDIA
ncbi:hypothetical protein G9P44_001801 [Scheffersomyces stipitis]|nr:hypothetical protein G9P44_001801 [Scheffersomyces stipitis]